MIGLYEIVPQTVSKQRWNLGFFELTRHLGLAQKRARVHAAKQAADGHDGECGQVHTLAQDLGDLRLCGGKSAIRNDSLDLRRNIGKRGRKQDGGAAHGNAVQNDLVILTVTLYQIAAPIAHVIPFGCAERQILSLAVVMCALGDDQHADTELFIMLEHASEIHISVTAVTVHQHDRGKLVARGLIQLCAQLDAVERRDLHALIGRGGQCRPAALDDLNLFFIALFAKPFQKIVLILRICLLATKGLAKQLARDLHRCNGRTRQRGGGNDRSADQKISACVQNSSTPLKSEIT